MGAVNELDYTDSLKMKMSVIFGVVQMMFGVILNILNYVHFGEYMSIILIGVPQVWREPLLALHALSPLFFTIWCADHSVCIGLGSLLDIDIWIYGLPHYLQMAG